MLDPRSLPALPAEQRTVTRALSTTVARRTTADDRRRGEACMAQVLDNLASEAPGGRNDALNRAAWTLGRWIAAGELQQDEVEDALYAAAEANSLVADDGQRQTWATIRSGLSTGLRQAVDLDADHRVSRRRRAS